MQGNPDNNYSVKCPYCETIHNGPVSYSFPDQAYVYCRKCRTKISINPDGGEVIAYDVWREPNPNLKMNYPGLYEPKNETPRFSPSHLFKAMYKPKEAFVELYHITDMKIGIMLLIIFGALSSIITFLANQISGSNNIAVGLGGELPLSWVTLAIISLPLAILTSVIVSWLSAKISEFFKGRNDAEKTIALMGYAGMPGFIMGLASSIVIAANIAQMPDYSDPASLDIGALLAYAAVMGAIGLVSLIWGLIVSGCAVSVANDVSFGEGVLCYFGASIIVGIATVIIMIPVVLLMI